MMYLTHAAVALFAGLLKVKLIPMPINKYVFLALVVIAGLFPDIDSRSFISKKLKLSLLSNFFKHRGFFHSIIPMVIFMIIAFLITQNVFYSLAIFIGFASHLIFDSFTHKGIAFFWPSKLRVKGPFRTGSSVDWVFFLVFFIIDVLLIITVF